MKKFFAFLLCIWGTAGYSLAQSGQTPFEQGQELVSATYDESIQYYQNLADLYPQISMHEMGQTDVGLPLQLVLISSEEISRPADLRKQGKRFLLINNGIHAGEPCGVDACMMLTRDLMEKPELRKLLDHLSIAIIPAYNIGGMLNRGCCSRANQNGPQEYGFRGNARNFDLNRDFIKTDTRNMEAFAEIFQLVYPDIFIDTHTTNGADYPATLTYIPTQPDKAGPSIASYMQQQLIPALESHMQNEGILICPYVNAFRRSPDHGISGFLDLPRYSSGYASLFQTMSFITEAHMLKPFKDRVWATYHFLEGLLLHVDQHHEAIGKVIEQDRQAVLTQKRFDVGWRLDRTKVDSLMFAGYAAKTKPSEISGQPRLYYDQQEPYEMNIPFLNTYLPTDQVSKPVAYVIPQSQYNVIHKLRINGVDMQQFAQDTSLTVEVDYIASHHTSERAYEGHFYHDQVEIRKDTQNIRIIKGDYIVYTNQVRNAYLIHVLEPKSQDSFFRWNYFDSFLMQKEYFSSYVFEDKAAAMLTSDPTLKQALDQQMAQDSIFANSGWMQLRFIYEQSEHYEQTHKRYPIFRWFQESPLPLMK